MPNWITNKIAAPKHVIEAMLNADGHIDFEAISAFPGPHNAWDDISCAAEEAAEIVCGRPVSSHPLVAALKTKSRAEFDIKSLSDECFQQFIGMVENYRACGYLHSMDFARQAWGTKWNACEQKHNADAGTAEFETAWSCPEPVLVLLSKRFPEDEISVTFADEDIGSNCGTFTLKAGAVIASDIAPAWRDMTEEQRAKWKAFAYQVRGWSPEDIADAEADD